MKVGPPGRLVPLQRRLVRGSDLIQIKMEGSVGW